MPAVAPGECAVSLAIRERSSHAASQSASGTKVARAKSSASSPGLGHALGGAMLMIILIVLLVLALGGGGWAHSRYGYAGWSPAGLILLVVVVLWLTGNLHI
jgi:hypothetical protein